MTIGVSLVVTLNTIPRILPQEPAEEGTEFQSEPWQEAEGAIEARQAELHHHG
jgi:hypothetical protein